MNKVKVYIERLNEDVVLPTYANYGDAGMDIRASEDVTIKEGETKIISTGIKVAIPEGYEIQVRARSGVSFKTPLRISNGIGTIDVGYRGEIGVIMTNTSIQSPFSSFNEYTIDDKGNQQGTYLIRKGDRIAQIVLKEVPQIEWEETNDVSVIGTDRNGGFGSSGTK